MKKFTIAICALSALTCLTAGACTQKDPFVEDGKISVGGEIIQSGVTDTQIIGAVDLHIPVTATDISGAGVEVYGLKNGLRIEAVADISDIVFGTQGVYKIKWLCDGQTVEKDAYVYGTPQITDAVGDVNCKYSALWNKVYDGLCAKDCFGNDLSVFVYTDGGLYNSDGTANVGTFNVKYCATDKSGQAVYVEKAVTVTEEVNPTINDAFDFDVADQTLDLTLDQTTAEILLGVSINGTALKKEDFTLDGVNLSVNGGKIAALAPVGQDATIRVFTQKGQTTSTLSVKDQKEIQFDDASVKEFIKTAKACFNSVNLPQIEMTNPYQIASPEYFISNGVERVKVGDNYIFNADGKYSFIVSARGKEYSYPIEAYYDLGFNHGKVYGKDGFDGQIKNGYELTGYLVEEIGQDSFGILKYEKGHALYGDLEAFKSGFKSLNPACRYTLTVTGKSITDGATFSQKVEFTTAGSGNAVLGYETVGLTPNNPEYTSLDYVSADVGGKHGVFHWNSLKDDYYQEGATSSAINGYQQEGIGLKFEQSALNNLTKDRYFTFDIYYTGSLHLLFNVDGETVDGKTKTRQLLLWGRYLTQQPQGLYGDDQSYTYGMVNIYSASGTKMATNADVFRSASCYGKWYTVEIKLPANVRGSLVIHGATALKDVEVYLANMRVSDRSLFADDTVNPSVSGDNEYIAKDVFPKE